MSIKERIELRIRIVNILIKDHEKEREEHTGNFDYMEGRKDGLIFGYNQELKTLKILLQEAKRNELQRPSITA